MDLIRFEFAVRQGKICNTTPMLAAALNLDKLKLFDQVCEPDADNAVLLKKLSMPPGDLTFVTFLTL